jgi:hypothetical protein
MSCRWDVPRLICCLLPRGKTRPTRIGSYILITVITCDVGMGGSKDVQVSIFRGRKSVSAVLRPWFGFKFVG